MKDENALVFDAAAFAARAHRNQERKDGRTPYVSHVFRVCLVVRHVFGFDDPKMLTAALLHDTIEDTTTDYDDVARHFGTDVANWVVALTKDMRLPDEQKEEDYLRVLTAADWQVKVIKLADIYDNMGDCQHFSQSGRKRMAARSRQVLEAVRPGIPADAQHTVKIVEKRLAQLEASCTS